ncbi:intracellular protein transport protein USO1, partial [Reticulomyxa filosa]
KEIRKLNLENETLKVELQLKDKKDKEIAHLKQCLEQCQKDNLQLNSAQACYIFFFSFHLIQKYQKQIIIIIIIKQKTTFVEMEKLKKGIKSKDNEIQKIKQKIQMKEKQIIEQQKNKQMNENKEEQKENIIYDNSSSIINTSSTLDFELLRSFKLLSTFNGHTGN